MSSVLRGFSDVSLGLRDFTQSIPLVALIVISLLTYLLIWVIYARHIHPLAKCPRPFLASITRFWYIFDVARGISEKTQRRLHEKYGMKLLLLLPSVSRY